MILGDVLAELRDRYSPDINQRCPNPKRLTTSDVQRWSTATGEARSDLYNQIAARLAFGFHDTEFSFSFCDAVVNDIHAVITRCNEDRPDLFWSVFLAFDAGEFYHDGNRDQDPVDTYTRPEIARIVDQLKA
jgi:hypothetical protein